MSIKKYINYFKLFYRTTKYFKILSKQDVLIFDKCGSENIIDLLPICKFEILHVRNESLNMFIFLKCLLQFNISTKNYIDNYIKSTTPKLIITFIDNNINFYEISKRHSNIITIFIQNGWRSFYTDIFEQLYHNKSKKYFIDYMFTFGNIISNEYKKYIIGQTIEIGSIRNNSSLPNNLIKKNNVITYVSQWFNGHFILNKNEYNLSTFSKKIDFAILNFLKKYVHNENKELYIIPRTTIGDIDREFEELYYYDILQTKVKYTDKEFNYNSYEALDFSEVVVGVDSTLLYESASRNVKTAFFSIRSNILNLEGYNFGWPGKYEQTGFFWTSIYNEKIFEIILNNLFNIDNSTWKYELNKVNFPQLLKYNTNNIIIKDFLIDKIFK
jgi:surface carbohydrate biosynthesis protein